MGYWSKGKFYETGPQLRQNLMEVRKVVDDTVAKVKAGEINAYVGMRNLLTEHPTLREDHRKHPLLESEMMALYTEFYVSKIVLAPKRVCPLDDKLLPASVEESESN